MEGPDSSREPPHHQWDGSDAATRLTEMNCLFHIHRNDSRDSTVILGVSSKAVRTGQKIGPSVRCAVRIIGVSVWLDLEPLFDLERKGICLRTVLEAVH